MEMMAMAVLLIFLRFNKLYVPLHIIYYVELPTFFASRERRSLTPTERTVSQDDYSTLPGSITCKELPSAFF